MDLFLMKFPCTAIPFNALLSSYTCITDKNETFVTKRNTVNVRGRNGTQEEWGKLYITKMV